MESGRLPRTLQEKVNITGKTFSILYPIMMYVTLADIFIFEKLLNRNETYELIHLKSFTFIYAFPYP